MGKKRCRGGCLWRVKRERKRKNRTSGGLSFRRLKGNANTISNRLEGRKKKKGKKKNTAFKTSRLQNVLSGGGGKKGKGKSSTASDTRTQRAKSKVMDPGGWGPDRQVAYENCEERKGGRGTRGWKFQGVRKKKKKGIH